MQIVEFLYMTLKCSEWVLHKYWMQTVSGEVSSVRVLHLRKRRQDLDYILYWGRGGEGGGGCQKIFRVNLILVLINLYFVLS
jgi:hypothetical protein